jgi:diacylglycerol kinase (ATP)
MSRRFVYFINPISGTKGKAGLLKLIEEKTKAQNIPFEILFTNAENNYEFLLTKIKQENITDIIVCGGDGTVNQIASVIQKSNINIGIIPMGSGNGLAFAAQIPKAPAKALQVIFIGNVQTVDAFNINKQFSCMLCGLGFDAQVAHDFAKQKGRGLKTYVKQSVLNFIKAKAYPFTLTIQEKNIETEAFFISIANSNQFGNNFTIAPKASLSDGVLDIVVVNKMHKLKMLWSILKQIKIGQVQMYEDKLFDEQGIYYFQTEKLVIKNPTLAPLHIDGDPVVTASEFNIEIIKGSFNLIVP